MIETGFEVARPLGGTPILIDQKILDEIAETVARAAGIFQCNSPNPDGTCPEAFLIKDTNGDPVPDISGFDTSYTELVLPPCPADFSYDLCDDWSLATPAGIGTSGNNLLLYSEHAVDGVRRRRVHFRRAARAGHRRHGRRLVAPKRRVRRCRPRRCGRRPQPAHGRRHGSATRWRLPTAAGCWATSHTSTVSNYANYVPCVRGFDCHDCGYRIDVHGGELTEGVTSSARRSRRSLQRTPEQEEWHQARPRATSWCSKTLTRARATRATTTWRAW